MSISLLVRALAAAAFVSVATSAAAQHTTGDAGTAIVVANAPIYLRPDTTRVPLRTAAVNTTLRIVEDDGDWLRVEFQDPQYGRRVGYIETRNVRIVRPEQEPMDLSIRPSGRGTEEQPQATGAEPHRDRSASSTATGAGLACLGQASTSSFAGFSAGFTNGVQTFSGLFGGGSDHYLSVGTVGYTDYTDLDASAWMWGGLFGGDLMPRGQIVHACPLGGVFYTHLMDSDFNELDIVAGGSLGIVALDTAAVGVIPYFSATYTRGILLDEDISLNAGAIGIGVGLVFQRRITLRPAVLFPLNMPGADPTFQVALTVGF